MKQTSSPLMPQFNNLVGRSPVPGTILDGKYRVVRVIGEGGMGIVLEAENTVSGKRVAIKWLRPSIALRPDAIERMVREARASARVRHPNVIDVYDIVQKDDSAFLVMELLEGEPLSALLARGPLPAHKLVAVLLEAMRGVLAAHEQGVVHRDIKPDNIFLSRQLDRRAAIPKVLDFGISKLADLSSESLTCTGAAVGTPLYMSLEQLSGVRDIDARTDVYAFGVILYAGLTGRAPFEAESLPELIVKVMTIEPPRVDALRPDLPVALGKLVERAMAKDREQRISLEALLRELQPFATRERFDAAMTRTRAVDETFGPSALSDPSHASNATTPFQVSTSKVVRRTMSRAGSGLIWASAGLALVGSIGWCGWNARQRDATNASTALHRPAPVQVPNPASAERAVSEPAPTSSGALPIIGVEAQHGPSPPPPDKVRDRPPKRLRRPIPMPTHNERDEPRMFRTRPPQSHEF